MKRTICLAVGDTLPTEFRLFTKGWNDTENGRFLFDGAAAKSVMAAYAAWGVDLAIDLDHAMIEIEPGASPDPHARDARGWCRLELRPDGSLWAVNVRWTPDGAKRLTDKTQRYVSPAFKCDPKTMRIQKIMNVAIVAMPATHDTPALVAASVNRKGAGMDPKLIRQALEALEKGDDAAARAILTNRITAAAGGSTEPDGDEAGSEGDGAEGTAPPAETEAVEDPKVVDAAADPDKDPEAEDPKEKKAAYKAMRVTLSTLSGKSDPSEIVTEVQAWRESHIALAAERVKLAKDREVLERDERRRLVADLVKLGAEFPATVFADPAKGTTLKPRFVKMPIAELRAQVAAQRAARGVKPGAPVTARAALTPPPGDAPAAGGQDVTLDDGKVVKLTAGQVNAAKAQGCDLKDFATLLAHRDGK